jgi:hypothetical protein
MYSAHACNRYVIRCSLLTGWYIRCSYAAVLSFPSRFVLPPRVC